jgi:hypothetical protein
MPATVSIRSGRQTFHSLVDMSSHVIVELKKNIKKNLIKKKTITVAHTRTAIKTSNLQTKTMM